MDTVEHLVLRLIYRLVALICITTPLWILVGLARVFAPPSVSRVIETVLFILMAASLLAAEWVASKALLNDTVLGEGFIESLVGAFVESAGVLSFLGARIRLRLGRRTRVESPDEPVEPR